MQNSFNINKKNYSSEESQELLSEISILLGKITCYVEGREKHIIFLEKQLKEQGKVKFLLKNIGRQIIYNIKKIISFIINKIKDKFRSYTK